ncbi:tetratricopeptide repeat protein [Blastomonas sp. AAP53]|uniref:tetratricopeptide repeat protein n=1 Tax=Blastomonas sp. AAP53 TaxID=1248760 RepID=UPI00126718AE|nr:tetratricopeptide repeat protein [Blastomonas sp. AAP53]
MSLDQPTSQDRRLDGWKAIAAYFRRDRTTVMRWARERSLPVHRLPGGKQGSVFAHEHELLAWASRHADSDLADGSAPAVQPLPVPTRPALPAQDTTTTVAPASPGRGKRLFVGLGAVVAVGALLAATLNFSTVFSPAQSVTGPVAALPDDPKTAADYVTARDLWARRTPADLRRAIALYEKVIAADADFAPAYVGLAEAWLIYREYGAATESRAYSAAKSAVEQALALDGELAAAHRANGFIQYWWSYDAQRSVDSFQRALELDPRDGLTHFWYANVLSDLGQDESAQHEYDTAQLMLPGTPAIAVERACAHWQAGRDRRAVMELNQLKAQYPGDATIRNCLAWAHISRGDIKAFAREYRALASLRNVPAMIKVSQTLDAAITRDPARAHMVLVADARREFAEGERKTRMTPAFHASCMGDRATLLALLQQASTLGERWYSATLNRRIADKWRNDAEVLRLLNKVMVATPDVDLS